MTPLRPTNLPSPPQTGGANPGGGTDRSAAQKAFFDIALGKTTAPVATQPSAPPAIYAQPVQRIPDPGAEPPQKILRPGSLLDIRV